jgi:hypothetical protein
LGCVCGTSALHVALDEHHSGKNKTDWLNFEILGLTLKMRCRNTVRVEQCPGTGLYNDVGMLPGLLTLMVGAVVASVSVFQSFLVLQIGLKERN